MLDENYLSSLPQSKIRKAIVAVQKKELPINFFYSGCKQILLPAQYNLLFKQDNQNEQEIKMEDLQDIVLFTGVDLKAEAEMIAKESEHNINYTYDSTRVDPNNDPLILFNGRPLMELVNKICKSKKVNVSNDIYSAIYQVVKRKL
jgi:hypothetical protein